jgi:hypothetical protein
VASDQGISMSDTCTGPSGGKFLGHGLMTNLAIHGAVSPDGQTLVAMLQDFGSAVSTDGGMTWASRPTSEDGYAAINPIAPLDCYAFRDGLYTSTDGCKTFNPPLVNVHSSIDRSGNIFAFDPVNPKLFYVVGSPPSVKEPDGGTVTFPPNIYKSTDGGMTLPSAGWTFTSPEGIAVAPHDGSHILVVDAGTGARTVNVSTNGGAAWKQATGIPTSDRLMIAFSGTSASTVLAAVGLGSTLTIYTSTDGGATFAKTSNPVTPGAAGTLTSLIGSPKGNFALTTRDGAYLSTDGGKSWQRLDTKMMTHDVSVAQWVNGYVYLATYGQGMLKSSVPLE